MNSRCRGGLLRTATVSRGDHGSTDRAAHLALGLIVMLCAGASRRRRRRRISSPPCSAALAAGELRSPHPNAFCHRGQSDDLQARPGVRGRAAAMVAVRPGACAPATAGISRFPERRCRGASAVCNNFCPASETKVVYGSNIDDAVTDNGKPYSELPNAFRYRTEMVDGCTCNGRDQFGLAPGPDRGRPDAAQGRHRRRCRWPGGRQPQRRPGTPAPELLAGLAVARSGALSQCATFEAHGDEAASALHLRQT